MATDVKQQTPLPDPRFSQRWYWGSQQAISFLMQQAVENRDVVSLAAGLVDRQSLPVTETRAAFEQLLADDGRARDVLQYGTTAGAERLRKLLLHYLAEQEGCTAGELGIDEQQLVLTTGSQQLLSLVCEVLLDPGDICFVAAPTYFVFLGTLNGVGARIVSIPTDEDGMRIDLLGEELERVAAAGELDRVKLIYVVSYYDNPAGISLSAARRTELVALVDEWSARQRMFILDDAAYRELRYDGPVLPSVWGTDASREHVILTQTFSKSFAPGLRVGFGVLPRALVGPICDRKGNDDFGSANLNQHLLATVMEEGLYAPHVDEVRASYRVKRDAMLAAADRWFGDLEGVSWVHPHGGLYVWMTLPESVDTSFHGRLFAEATKVQRVMYVPGDQCYAGAPDTRPNSSMRLSFGVQTPEGIDEGMRRLAASVRAVM